jgi:hypothetical protein
MVAAIYQQIGTAVSFASAGDVAFSAASVGFGAGRKSAQWDRGASPQPAMYSWRAKLKLQATPVVGETIDFYMATSDGTIIDGTTTAADAAFTDEDALPNMVYLGSVVVDMVTTDSIQASGTFWMPSRYGVLVMWNSTAAETLSATAGDHDFIVTPIYDEVQ